MSTTATPLTVKGQILHKNITPKHFDVTYQCPCGGTVAFHQEERQTCRLCHTIYALRVMVGKVSKP